jgi:hypothetical protein
MQFRKRSLSQIAALRPGCRKLKRTRAGPIVGLYNAREAKLCDAGGAWVLVCEDHGNVSNYATIKEAEYFLPDPMTWCEDCGKPWK